MTQFLKKKKSYDTLVVVQMFFELSNYSNHNISAEHSCFGGGDGGRLELKFEWEVVPPSQSQNFECSNGL
jgi:hypothetical protein